MGNNRGGVEMSFNVQSAIDGKYDIILDYNVSTNPSDQGQMGIMSKKLVRKGFRVGRWMGTVGRFSWLANPEMVVRIRISQQNTHAAIHRHTKWMKTSDAFTLTVPRLMPSLFNCNQCVDGACHKQGNETNSLACFRYFLDSA